ncbi:pancreatic lipase-related protein 2-like [Maniola jurtina]|uniref:pancreatic lipase-related protein 2-like n=1 Tax=Maniola jurtina TaxID=191418 RepID=UPI001E68BDB3|nr:pancreatic lipase-related protein 2-like [Maniola jurtina]
MHGDNQLNKYTRYFVVKHKLNMKLLVVLFATVALCAGTALPVVPGDNSHYVEGVSRYIWMDNGEGTPELVDLEEPVDELALAEARNGANNQYWLFTRWNRVSPQIILNGNVNSLRNSNYNGARALKVIVHGWRNNGNSPVNTLIRNAFLDQGDHNVIVVDWRALADQSYNNAVRGVVDVGRHVANFVQWLINTGGGNWNRVHLVGHSLGAHIVGNAGRLAPGTPVRVTGLDPAGPQWGNNRDALNRNSGTYVEAIHTDGRATGIMDPSGHADFYPNGGRAPQPGCGISNSCAHGRAFEFYASTITRNHLIGRQCRNLHEAELSSCTGVQLRMGNADLGKRGNGLFGLRTGNAWPF